MGLKRQRLTWLLLAGLAGVFLGERIVAEGVVRGVLTGLGLAALLAATAAAVVAWRRSEGEERRIAGLLALMYAGTALGLLGFLVGTEDWIRALGLDFEQPADEDRFRAGLWTASAILFVASLLPALAAQWALRTHGGEAVEHRRVDAMRIVELATSALSVALAGAFLMLAGYVASERDVTYDASYFKTASPGTSVEEIVRGMEQPLRVLLFFPHVHPVKDEVLRYFRALESATGNVQIQEHDRLLEPRLAELERVGSDAVVILRTAGRSERFALPTTLDAARPRLIELDGEVQRTLLRLLRERRVIYLTAGHGERSDFPEQDTASVVAPSAGQPRPERPLQALRTLFGLLNYEARDFGLMDGLGSRIPDDAAAVFVVGATKPFLEEEVEALREYLGRGGSLLVAMERDSEFRLDGLRDILGVELRAEAVIDDQQHMRQRGGLADRRLIVTNRISAHPSTRTAARRLDAGILFIDAAHLVQVEGAGDARTRFVIQTLRSSFPDLNGNLRFDEGPETRGSLNLVAAVEGPGGGEGGDMRALVYADADVFSDPVLSSLAPNASIVADGVRWLGREEAFSGEIESEADVPIVHTRSENVVWFYAVILGAPVLVLGVGLSVALSAARRRRAAA